MRDVVVLVGSRRTGSFNRKMAHALQDVAQGTLALQQVEIGVFLNLPTLQQPEMYIGAAAKLFDADGQLISEGHARVPADVHRRVRRVDREDPVGQTSRSAARSSPPDVHSARSATSGSTRVARRAGT